MPTCYAPGVKRLLVILVSLFLSANLAYGSVAHAMEPTTSIDNRIAYTMGHTPGDADQVPADSDKGYPHHHAGCHDHQLGEPEAHCTSPIALMTKAAISPALSEKLVPSPTTPENRPPIA